MLIDFLYDSFNRFRNTKYIWWRFETSWISALHTIYKGEEGGGAWSESRDERVLCIAHEYKRGVVGVGLSGVYTATTPCFSHPGILIGRIIPKRMMFVSAYDRSITRGVQNAFLLIFRF